MAVCRLVREQKIIKENAKSILQNYFPFPEALVVNLWVFVAMNWCIGFGHHNDVMVIGFIGILCAQLRVGDVAV